MLANSLAIEKMKSKRTTALPVRNFISPSPLQRGALAHHVRAVLCAGCVLLAWGFFTHPLQANIPCFLRNAVWVYPDPSIPALGNPVSDPAARQALINNSAASGVNVLYVSVFQDGNHLNSAQRYLYDETAIADLITLAHAQGIAVYAAYGAPDWPTFGCAAGGFPLKRMGDVASYNTANPWAKLDGVVLDIEPTEPIDSQGFQALLTQYQCIRQTLPNDVGLSVAIRFFWGDTSVEFPVGSGVTKKVYEHVIDMAATIGSPPNYPPGFVNVIIMGYRDFAGPGLPRSFNGDGIISFDQDQIAYADSLFLDQLIQVGLETLNPASVSPPIEDKVTFFEEGQTVLNSVAQVVFNHFGCNSFGGFAIHNYGNSYLSGSQAKWPTTNPSFPTHINDAQEVATNLGSNVPVSGGTVASVTVGFNFPNITAPGYTYVTPIDPSSAGTLPTGYELTGVNLAFDIITTAQYTPPVLVAFQVPSVDPTTFVQLKVLHNSGSGLVDVTASNPPPDPVTQTIYASVTSFSPFVIAKLICTPPIIQSVTASPSSLWPPNKKFVPITVTVPANATCGSASTKIISMTSNESGGGQYQVTGDLTVNLLADRNGNGTGRIYTITVQCKDRFGNASTKTVTVTVPHDQGH